MNDEETKDYLVINYIIQLYSKIIDVKNFKQNLAIIHKGGNSINPDNLNDYVVYFSILSGLCFIDFTSIFNYLKIEKAEKLYNLFIKELYKLVDEEMLINNFFNPMRLSYLKDIKENTVFDYRISTLWKCITFESTENDKVPNVEEMILDYMTHRTNGIAKSYLEEIGYIEKYGKNIKDI